MGIRELKLSDVPGKLGGNTAAFMTMPEFKDLSARIHDGIPSGMALEVELSPESFASVKVRKPLDGFKRAVLKLHSQKLHAYDAVVKGTRLYVVGLKEPKHKNGVPAAKKRSGKK